jgi:signal transduction histidine kinase
MTPAWVRALRDRIGPFGRDGLLALALVGLTQAELWMGERYEGYLAFPGSRVATAPFLLVAALALAWRRRAPTACLSVVMCALAVQSLATGGTEAAGTFALLLIATYSAVAYGQRLWLSAAIAVAGVAIHDLKDPYIHGLGDALFAYLFVAVGLGLGSALHGRRARTLRLTEEARRLRRERDQHTRQAVAAERARIARELHDIVAHSVSVMVVQALAGQSALNGEQSVARQSFSAIEHTGRQAMAEMRRLLSILREDHQVPPEPQPGIEQLPELVDQTRRAGLSVQLEQHGDRATVSPGVGLAIYRIVQEALTNSLKHAGPTTAQVTVRYTDTNAEVTVTDHGPIERTDVGPELGAGHGIHGMRERAAIYGGELHAGPTPDGGFSVGARIPLTETAAR